MDAHVCLHNTALYKDESQHGLRASASRQYHAAAADHGKKLGAHNVLANIMIASSSKSVIQQVSGCHSSASRRPAAAYGPKACDDPAGYSSRQGTSASMLMVDSELVQAVLNPTQLNVTASALSTSQ